MRNFILLYILDKRHYLGNSRLVVSSEKRASVGNDKRSACKTLKMGKHFGRKNSAAIPEAKLAAVVILNYNRINAVTREVGSCVKMSYKAKPCGVLIPVRCRKLCVYVATALYVVFCYLFLGIKYSRVRRYYKTMYYMSLGLKSVEMNYFYCFDEKVLQKETIDVHSCIFEIWDRKYKEWLEREVYCDPEKPLPPFEEGDEILYVTQSSYLLQYEIKQKKAVEFEEVDE